MDIIDLQTVRTTLIDLGVFITAIVVFYRNQDLDGVFEFTIFTALILLNGILMNVPSTMTIWLSLLANISLLLAFICCFSSVSKLLMTEPKMQSFYWVIGGYLIFAVLHLFIEFPTITRILGTVFISCYICYRAILLIMKNSTHNVLSPSENYLVVIFSLLFLSFVFRLLVFLFPNFISSNINLISIVALSSLFLFLSFGLLLLIFEVISKKLIHLSEKDFLAGINNRRGFFKELKANKNEECAPYLLAIMDVDHFKKVNDEFGHGGGDFVIKFISDSLVALLSKEDIVGRFGGEEFCILLNNKDDMALERLENIRSYFADEAVTYHSENIKFTVSFGCVKTNLIFEELIHKLLSFADQALYKAKATGRNRVVSFEELLKQNSAI